MRKLVEINFDSARVGGGGVVYLFCREHINNKGCLFYRSNMFSLSFGSSANEIGTHPSLPSPHSALLASDQGEVGNGKETRRGRH
jgi:hypothetical protein